MTRGRDLVSQPIEYAKSLLVEPRRSIELASRKNQMNFLRRAFVPAALALPLLVASIPDADAGRRGRGRPELEVTNRANKTVRCDLLDYRKNASKGTYFAPHASVTVAKGATKRNKKRFVNYEKIGAICYFAEDYPANPPAADLQNGLGPGPFHRTGHFPDAKSGKIMLTVYSNISNVTVTMTKKRSAAPNKTRRRRP